MTQSITITCYTIILLLHPVITTSTFSLFSCVKYEDGKTYLRRDMDIECWGEEQVKFSLLIGIPFIAVWTIGFPVYIFIKMRSKRSQFDDTKNLKLYGLFYVGLSNDVYYWEIIVVNLRKLLIIAAGTFLNQDYSSFKALLTIIVLMSQNYYTRKLEPYIDPRNTDIDFHSSMASILILFGGMFFIDADV